ncbi:hypothetical protein SDC9_187792 [bioreactor metagenome]|uniref:Uncharacterized protein n=1 Tax=bioreactor metagenome TaxID=1076179 RepID=A0A645HNV3_9ZZZZ
MLLDCTERQTLDAQGSRFAHRNPAADEADAPKSLAVRVHRKNGYHTMQGEEFRARLIKEDFIKKFSDDRTHPHLTPL